MSKQKSSSRFRFTGAAMLLAGLLFLVPALNPVLADKASVLYLLAVLVPCVIFLCGTLLARMFSLDRMLVTLSLFISAAGIAALALSDPDVALTHSLRCAAGIGALLIGGIMIRTLSPSLLTSVCTAFLGLLLLAGRLITSTLTFPVIEAACALLLISFASLLARQGPVSASLTGAAAAALLLAGGSTPDALLWGIMILLLLFAGDGRLAVVIPSLAAVAALFFCAFRLSPVTAASLGVPSGDLLASIGALGSDVLPEGIAPLGTFSIFPRLAGHYGLIFAGLTFLLFLPLALRGSAVAVSSRTRFHAVLAMGISLLLALRALAGMLAFFGFLPLAGLDIPLLTSSLPDLCAQMFLVGLLSGISGRNDADLAEDAHLAMLAK